MTTTVMRDHRSGVARLLGSLVATAVIAVSPTPSQGQAQDTITASTSGARAAWLRGDYEGALDQLQGASGTAALRMRARVLIETGAYPDALRLLGGASGPAPSPDLERLRGDLLRQTGELEAAETAFESSLRQGAVDAELARLRIGELAFHAGEREQAMSVFDGFIDLYNSGRALNRYDLMAVAGAVTWLGRGDPALYQDALRAYDEAAAAAPGDPEPILALGHLFLRTYQITDAYDEFARILDLNPNHPDALVGRARAQAFDNDPNALSTAQAALETNPNQADAHAVIAGLRLRSEGTRAATEAANEALEINPAHLEALSVLAAAQFLENDQGAFEETIARIDAIDPAYGGAHATAAEFAVSHRKYAESIELSREALRRDPALHETRGKMGMNQLRLGLLAEGRANVEMGFAGDPFNPWFKNTLDLIDTFEEYETLETEHFRIFLHRDDAGLIGAEAERVAEEAWASLAERYGEVPDAPVRIELFPSSADFSVRSLGLAGLGALGVSFGPTLVMDAPSARDAGSFNWHSVLWHELAHSFHLGISNHEVPRWFSEGLAMREQRRVDSRWGFKPSVAFFSAFEQGEMPKLSNMNEGLVRPSFPGQVGLTYFQASLVFDWWEEEWGFGVVRDFLTGYRDGARTPELTRDLLGMSVAEADEAFDAYIRDRFEREIAATVDAPVTDPDARAGPVDGAINAAREIISFGRIDEEAVQVMERAVEIAPDNFRFRLSLGTALLVLERPDDAEEHLRAALRLFPAYEGPDGPLRGLARIHIERDETQQAADALRRLGYLSETAYEVPLDEAELRRELGDLEGEQDALERAVEVFPYQLEVQQRRAEVAVELADLDREIAARQAVLALNPPDRAESHYRLALALQKAGRIDEARTQVIRSLEIAPRFSEALDLLLVLRGGGS